MEKTAVVTKGAVEEMLSICTFAEYNGEVSRAYREKQNQVLDMVKLN